jgi:N-acetylglucosamine PTS system EIICBA or EIICB component
MSATSTETAKGGSGVLAVLQRVGRSLMLPIAVLPAAAILLRFGQSDWLVKLGGDADVLNASAILKVLANAGGALFDNLPLLFAVGIAVGFAKKSDGTTAVAALVGYLVFKNVLAALPDAAGKAQNPGVFGGILMGIVSALLWQRYYRTKLPDFLAFFGGRRFVPLVTALAGMVLGVVVSVVWVPIGAGLGNFSEWLYASGAVGAGLFGAANRLLIPLGMHHFINSFVWFGAGSCTNAAGEPLAGDLTCFFATAGQGDFGMFMTGFFPVMMFGLPAAALAIVHTARPERRAAVAGIMLSAALTSFLTGITEPIEFAFIFIAPLLFALHIVLTGVSLALTTALGVQSGFGFSAGLTDLLINWSISDKPGLLVGIGLAYAVIYYVLFRVFITKFDLKTPGRESSSDDTAAGMPSIIDEYQTR